MNKKRKNFVPSIMPCTKEQFEQLRPHLGEKGIRIASLVNFNQFDHIVNDFMLTDGLVTNVLNTPCMTETRILIPTFNIEKFLENTNI